MQRKHVNQTIAIHIVIELFKLISRFYIAVTSCKKSEKLYTSIFDKT